MSWISRLNELYPGKAIFKPQEVAELFAISESTVKNMCFTLEIDAVKVGSQWRICRADLVKYINKITDNR